MSDVQDFIKEKGLQPTRSTLAPYTAEILELRELGFSYRVIAEFLHEKKGLKTSFQNVAAFIRSCQAGNLKTVNTVTQPPAKHIKNPAGNTPARRDLRKQTPTAPETVKIDRHPINTGFKKFNSREQLDIDDLI